MSKRALVVLSLVCLAAGAAWAASDPMVGDWKLNPQKSKLVDEMKVASLGGNKYSFDLGGPQPEIIVPDGTDQPGLGGTTLAVTTGPTQWTVVRKKDGRIQVRGIWTLSPDGKQLHDDFTEYGDQGKSIHVNYVYDRRAEGTGFEGDWVSTSEQVDTVYVLELRPYDGDGLSMKAASEGVARNLKFDGKDYPRPDSKTVSSARRVNERMIQLTDKIDAKILDFREMSVSPDGKTLTLTIHVPGHADPNVLVFDRQ